MRRTDARYNRMDRHSSWLYFGLGATTLWRPSPCVSWHRPTNRHTTSCRSC